MQETYKIQLAIFIVSNDWHSISLGFSVDINLEDFEAIFKIYGSKYIKSYPVIALITSHCN